MNADAYPGERRRHPRFTQPPLCLTFDDRLHVTRDWSLGGFVTTDYTGAFSPGSLFTVRAMGGDAQSMTPVAIRSRVVRISRDKRRLSANFLVIDRPAYALFRRLMNQRDVTSCGEPRF